MISGHDIICLSTTDWDNLLTRKQRFMQKFARQGNRVLYIEAQVNLLNLATGIDNWRRVFRWIKGPRKIEDNLYVATLPLVLPFFQMSVIINRINNWFILRFLKSWLRRLDFRNIILWTYTPYSDSFIGKLGEKLAIYECVDEFSASRGLVRPKTIASLERRLLKSVDIVVVTHDNLYKSKKNVAKNIYTIPNGAEVEHFNKASLPQTQVAAEIKDIPNPVIGFLGLIQYWIDLDLIRHIAVSRPKWSIVLIGPVGRLAEINKVKKLPNVYLLGRKNYTDLPSYIKAVDVCINPYVLDGTAQNCSPLKLYEYLASGKPIVSVDMPEARKFDSLLSIGLDYDDFVKKIQRIIENLPEDKTKIDARIKSSEKHSWNIRFSKLEEVLEQYI